LPNNLERAREYRAMEGKLRARAERAQFSELRAEFYQLAECYGRLANRLESGPPPLEPDALVDGILGIA
jgi:hypothetical protein